MKYLASLLLIYLVSSINLFSQTWSQIGPEGGYFKEFTFHPTDPNTVYAGSDDGGGIWKSTDAGETWTFSSSSIPNMTGWKITIDENQPSTVYACDLYGRYGVAKSTDDGANWNVINSGLTSTYEKMVSGLVVKTSDTLFISTGESATSTPPRPGNGVFKSYDAGNTWVPAGLQGIVVPSIGKNEFGTIFAGTEDDGLQFTNDNGSTWAPHPDIPLTGTVFEIESDGNIVVVASSEGVFLSTNWGVNFTNIGLAGEFNFDMCIKSTSPDIEIYSSTLTGLKYYTSVTSTWITVPGAYFVDQIIIGIESNGTDILTSGFSNSPIMKSADGGLSWNQTGSSPICTELLDLIIDPNDDQHMFTCLMGSYNLNGDYDREAIYETSDGGMNWTRKGPDAHGLCLTFNPLDPNIIYLGSFAQGVYRTNDGFNTFTQLSPDGITVGDIAVSSEDTSVVLISEFDFSLPATSIKRSNDGGNSFTVVSNLITNRLMFNPNDNDTVYAATSDGVHLSTDFGLTFSPWILAGEDCRSLEVQGSDLYVGTTAGVLYKVENGVPTDISGSWSTPVEIKSILSKGVDLFVGLNGAEKDTFMVLQGSIWRSSDDGTTWNDITSDMTSTNIYGNNIVVSDGSELFVGTYGGGVFKSSGLNLDAGIEEENSQSQIELYPNPAQNILNLRLGEIIPGSTKIMDLSGRVVYESSPDSNEGSSSFQIDIEQLANGVYILEIVSADQNQYSVKFTKG